MLFSYCFDYCGFIIYFEIRKCDAARFVLFQDCFDYLVFFAVQYDLLGCFHTVAVANNAAMNTGVRQFFERVILLSLSIYPEMGLLDHIVVLFLIC